jgi:hypothetical protein
LAYVIGSLILAGGLGWTAFQIWPRGPVERAMVAEIAAVAAATPRFLERTGAASPFAELVGEGESSPVFADLHGEGLLDLVTGGSSGQIRVFRNLGTRTRPSFAVAAENPFGLVETDTSNSVAFADLDGDGDLDAVNAGTNGALTYFQNQGTREEPNFVLLAPENDPFYGIITPAESYDWHPVFADIDGDGDIDLFLGTRDGAILFLENRGTARDPRFDGVARLAPFGLRQAGEHVSLAFADLDGDGDLDAITGNAAGDLLVFENRGTSRRPEFKVREPGALGLGRSGRGVSVALADLDGDGDFDCVAGDAAGAFHFFENVIITHAGITAGSH